MVEVEITRSGMISKITYDESEKLLTLTFASGGAYSYKDVPKEVFDGLLAAESAGKYFHAHIKGKYDADKV
jgi:hypothetical protein